jgi:hypothetical protein
VTVLARTQSRTLMFWACARHIRPHGRQASPHWGVQERPRFGGSLPLQAIPHNRANLLSRGQHTQERRAAAVDDGVAIHENFELSVPTVDHIHVGL